MKTRKHGHSWHKRATLPRSLARPVLLLYRVAWRAHNNPHKHHRAVTRIRAVSSCSRVIERAAENADTETLCEAYHADTYMWLRFPTATFLCETCKDVSRLSDRTTC